MKEFSWVSIKQFTTDISTISVLNYIESADLYLVWFSYQGLFGCTNVHKNTSECTEFETDYKPYIKKKVSPEGLPIAKNQLKDRYNYTYFTDYGDNTGTQTRGNGEELLFDVTPLTSTITKYLEFLDNVYIKDGVLKYFDAGWHDHLTFEVVCPAGKYLPNGQIAQQEIVLNRFINKCHVYSTGTQQFFTEDSAFLPAGYQIKVTAVNTSLTTWKAIVNLKLYRETTT